MNKNKCTWEGSSKFGQVCDKPNAQREDVLCCEQILAKIKEIVTPPPLPSIRIICSIDGGYAYYLFVECPHCGEPSLPKWTRDVTVELRAGNIHNVSPALDLPPHRSAKDETTQCPGWQGFYRNGKFEAAA